MKRRKTNRLKGSHIVTSRIMFDASDAKNWVIITSPVLIELLACSACQEIIMLTDVLRRQSAINATNGVIWSTNVHLSLDLTVKIARENITISVIF